jgi:prophage regulatory protein
MSQSLPETGYVRLSQILQVFPVSPSTWWLGVKEGRYPQSVKLGPRTTAWRAEDIRELLERFEKRPTSSVG